MPTYEFKCQSCQHEWEEYLSIKAPDPACCESCKTEGNILRLISGGSGKGVVELTGDDLVNKMKADAKQLKKDIHASEKLYSNVLSETRYEALQKRIDKNKRDRKGNR